jgi:hypothetical protein
MVSMTAMPLSICGSSIVEQWQETDNGTKAGIAS